MQHQGRFKNFELKLICILENNILNLTKYGEWEDYKNKTGNYESVEDNDAFYDSTRPGRPEIKKKYKKGSIRRYL